MTQRIRRVAVVGAGTMGAGIAEACVQSGLTVALLDALPGALDHAISRIRANQDSHVAKGRSSAEARDDRLSRLQATTDYAVCRGVDLVIEAVPERIDLKMDVLRKVAAASASDVLIASNTSSIPISALAVAVSDPTRFLGIHFFNPVSRMTLVEVISAVQTSGDTVLRVQEFVQNTLEKCALLIGDRPGFVVNALLIPYLFSAVRMHEAGYASAGTIDEGMVRGCGHPMGPLALSDMIGLDVIVSVADAIYGETRDPALVVANSIRRLLDAGSLGRKTGQGFYEDNSDDLHMTPIAKDRP